MSKFVYADFEFNGVSNPKYNLVCAVLSFDDLPDEIFWLHGERYEEAGQEEKLTDRIQKLMDDRYIFVAFAAIAEIRSILSLDCGLMPTWRTHLRYSMWIDLHLEWKMLTNHNNKLKYGKQLIDGKVVTTKPAKPKWMRSAEDNDNHSKAQWNLAAACYKLLGVEIDTEHKTKMRDLIISSPERFSRKESQDIIKYCQSDTKYLPKMLEAVVKQYKSLLFPEDFKEIKPEMLIRGNFAKSASLTEALGQPIEYDWTSNFADNAPKVLYDIQRFINKQFPDLGVFKYNPKSGKYIFKQENTRKWVREWCKDNRVDNWEKTETGAISLSKDAFSRYFSFRHDYPDDNFGAQIVRFLKAKTELKGFDKNRTDGKRSFWDSVGTDRRVRPYLNIYGSQSARNQPQSTGFLFLKPAWIRSIMRAKKGRAICGIDYGSEEFLIAALLSEDKNMIKAYHSGDVYLWFGKHIGKIPKNATKKTHGEIRDRFKATVLAIQYNMGAESLALKIKNDTGEACSEEEAEEYIDDFFDTFSDFGDYVKENSEAYEQDGYLKLPCGWTMFGNNPNWRSVANFPVQGAGSSIMRKSAEIAQDYGLDVIQTLHDATYIEFDSGDNDAMDLLADAMDEAFRFYFRGSAVEQHAGVRLDPSAWSVDYPLEDGEICTPNGLVVKRQNIYIDGRSKREYEQFSKYFLENTKRNKL